MTKHLETLALRAAGLPPAGAGSFLMPRPRTRFEPAPAGETPEGLEIEGREVAAGSALPGSEDEASSRSRRARYAAEADHSDQGESRRRPPRAPRVTAMPRRRLLEPSARGRGSDGRPGEEDVAAAAALETAAGRGDRSETPAPTPAESSLRPPRAEDPVHEDGPARRLEPSPAARPAGERSPASRDGGLRPPSAASSDQAPGEAAAEEASRPAAMRGAADARVAADAADGVPATRPAEPGPARPTLLEPAPPPASPSPGESDRPRFEPARTAVHVTIGRIEVEVAPPPAPPPSRARPEPRRGFEGYGPARRGRLR